MRSIAAQPRLGPIGGQFGDNGVAGTHAITLTAVPEPGTASLLGLTGVAFLFRRLRARKPARG